MNTLRDRMKDYLRCVLADYQHVKLEDVDANLIAELADAAFDACEIDEKKQDRIVERNISIMLSKVGDSK